MDFRCLKCGEVNAVGIEKIPISGDQAFWLRIWKLFIPGFIVFIGVLSAGISLDHWVNHQRLIKAIGDPSIKIKYTDPQEGSDSFELSR